MKINSSSLYNTIGDKHELFVRCVQHYTDIRKKDWQKLLASDKQPFNVLIDYINSAVDVIIDGENSCLAIKTAFEVATNDQRIKDILKADSDYADYFLYELIRKAMAQGAIRDDEEPELLADYFNSTWKGWYESYIIYKDPIKIRKMAQYFIKQISR